MSAFLGLKVSVAVSKDKSKSRDQKPSRRRQGAGSGQGAPTPALPLTDSLIEQITEWAKEAAIAQQCELYELEAQAYGPWHIRVSLDPEGPYEHGKSVTIDECVSVSRYMEAIFDADERIPERYTLEVSSPGIERVLRRPEHYKKLIGEAIRVQLRQPINEQYRLDGVLSGFDNDIVTLTIGEEEAPEQVSLPLSQIKKANVAFDFD